MKFLIIILTLLFIQDATANVVSGKVIDSKSKEKLISATVILKELNKGKYTDTSGRFEFDLRNDFEGQLIVSLIGYKSKTINIKVSNSRDILIELESSTILSNEIVVSANKKIDNVQEVPISVSVLSQDNINFAGLNSVENVLDYVPGIKVNRDNISLRGSSGFTFGVGSRVALLVDGFPMLAGDNGDMKFNGLPLFSAERIEVVKGAGSALYGTSAIGGVINLITQEPDQNLIKYRLYGGAFTPHTYDEWRFDDSPREKLGLDLMAKGKIGDLGVLFNGSFYNDRSYRYYDEERLANGFLKLNYDLNTNNKISLFAGYSDNQSDDWPFWNSLYDAFTPPDNTNDSVVINSDRYNLFLKTEHNISENMFASIRAGYYRTDFSNTWPLDNEEYRQSNAHSYNIESQLNYYLNKNLFATMGLNALYNDVDAFTFGQRFQRILSGYFQSEYTGIEKLIINLGLRFDQENSEGISSGPQLSPKLGINYRVNEFLTLRGSGGRGFRAPQIAERYSTIAYQGFRVIQNQDLSPEFSWSGELGLNYYRSFKDLEIELDIAVFQNQMLDMIEPRLDESIATSIQFVNLREARIRGTEINARAFLFGFLGLETGLQVLDPWDLTDDAILKYRSKVISKSRFFLPFGNFRFEGNFRYLSKMERYDELLAIQVTNSEQLNDAYIVDLRLNYNLSSFNGQPLQISLYSNNILNYYYTQMVGNMAPTRFVGIQFSGEIR